jgi:alkylated DNA repair dioxygenase AlkB
MTDNAWEVAKENVALSQLSLFNDLKMADIATIGTCCTSVKYLPNYLQPREADALYKALLDLRGWRQDCINLYGKVYPLPRLHRWFAETSESYRWSGIQMVAEPFPGFLRDLLNRVSKDNKTRFNTALGNLYRNGKDSVAWHSDDEPDLGANPTIASLSLGATRRFLIRKKNDHKLSRAFNLSHGSLLIMSGTMQVEWEHCIPKAALCDEARINLTFRAMNTS